MPSSAPPLVATIGLGGEISTCALLAIMDDNVGAMEGYMI